jgi:hypothetical protein
VSSVPGVLGGTPVFNGTRIPVHDMRISPTRQVVHESRQHVPRGMRLVPRFTLSTGVAAFGSAISPTVVPLITKIRRRVGSVCKSDSVGKILRQHRQHYSDAWRIVPAPGSGFPDWERPSTLTILTVLTVSGVGCRYDAFILIIRVPALPSRVNVMSMPSARSDVWARRNRPARALGDFGQPEPFVAYRSAEKSALTRRRSDALPVHVAYLLIISLMWAATGSASITSSVAAFRFSS